MTTITGPAGIALSRFDGTGCRTDHFRDLKTMLAELLMNSGDEIPYLVRDELLPPAIKAWDRRKVIDNCKHKIDSKSGQCAGCGESFEPSEDDIDENCR
jgi:hypothetical protein